MLIVLCTFHAESRDGDGQILLSRDSTGLNDPVSAGYEGPFFVLDRDNTRGTGNWALIYGALFPGEDADWVFLTQLGVSIGNEYTWRSSIARQGDAARQK